MNQAEYSIELEVFFDDLGQNKETFELQIGNNIIGSNPKECNIYINKPEVEMKHIQIEIEIQEKTNLIISSICVLKSEKGTQKKSKDGSFISIPPEKWTLINLTQQYKFTIKKVPKGSIQIKPYNGVESLDTYQNLQGNVKQLQTLEEQQKEIEKTKIMVNEQDQKKSKECKNEIQNQVEQYLSDKDEQNKHANSKFGKNFKPKGSPTQIKYQDKQENQNEVNQQVEQKLFDQDNAQFTTPKQFGKNFQLEISPVQVKSLHGKFKSPDQGRVQSIWQNNNKSIKPKIEMKPEEIKQQKSGEVRVSFQTPLKNQQMKNTNQKTVDTKELNKNVLKQELINVQKIVKSDNGQKKLNKEQKELDINSDLSNKLSNQLDKIKDKKVKKPDAKKTKKNIKIISTDDEDDDDKKKASAQTTYFKMIDESKYNSKNQKQISHTESKLTTRSMNKNKPVSLPSNQVNKQNKEQQQKKISLKRKAQDELNESEFMIIEQEDDIKEVFKSKHKNEKQINQVEIQQEKDIKSNQNQNFIGLKKRINEQVDEDKNKKSETEMKDEGKFKDVDNNQNQTKQKINDNNTNPQIIIKKIENQNNEIVDDKKIIRIPQKMKVQQEFLFSTKKKVINITQNDNKNTAIEQISKSDKTNKMETKKQDKKKVLRKLSEKKNSIIKNNLDIMLDESDEEHSYLINSDGEEEFYIKNNSASKQSASKKIKKFNVLFSNCEFDQDYYHKFSKLGAKIMKKVQQPFNILVMDDFTRRTKVLVALNKGAKILQSQWVIDCVIWGKLIDELEKYEIKIDKNIANYYKFDLKEVQQRNLNQDQPIFQNIQFILPDEEIYSSISRNDLEYLINTAGGMILTEDEYMYIEDKSNIKVIFDIDITPDQNQSIQYLLDNKKNIQFQNRQRIQQAFSQDNFDCVKIESIYQSCLHQKVCNWNEFQV